MFEGVVALVDAFDDSDEEDEHFEEEEEEEDDEEEDEAQRAVSSSSQGYLSNAMVDIDGATVAVGHTFFSANEAAEDVKDDDGNDADVEAVAQNTQRRRRRKKQLGATHSHHNAAGHGVGVEEEGDGGGKSYSDGGDHHQDQMNANDYATASRAALVAQQTFTQEMLREKEKMLEALKSENQTLLQEQNQRRREAEFFKSAAIQARDDLLRVESELRVSVERCLGLERDLEAHQQLSNRLLEQKEKEKIEALKAATAADVDHARERIGSAVQEGEEEKASEGEQSNREKKEDLVAAQACWAKREGELLNQLQLKERTLASLQQEITHLRDANRRATMEKDELRIAVETLDESLKGELAAHQETQARLRTLRDERAAPPKLGTTTGGGRLGPSIGSRRRIAPSAAQDAVLSPPPHEDDDDRSSSAAVAPRESSPLPIPPQVAQLTRRLHELEASLSAAKHDASEWKESYEQLVRRQSNTAALSTGSAYGISTTGSGSSGGVLGLGGPDDRAVRALFATPSSAVASSSQCKGAVKRSRRMTQLARKGRPARFAVAALNVVDDLFLDVLQAIVNHLPLRLLCTYYLMMLHLYFLLSLRLPVSYGAHKPNTGIGGFEGFSNTPIPVNTSFIPDPMGAT